MKITPIRENESSFTIRLCGELTEQYLPEIERILSEKPAALDKASIDLTNVTFVDREAMVFLCSAKARKIVIEHCPSYVTRWMQQERICGPSKK